MEEDAPASSCNDVRTSSGTVCIPSCSGRNSDDCEKVLDAHENKTTVTDISNEGILASDTSDNLLNKSTDIFSLIPNVSDFIQNDLNDESGLQDSMSVDTLFQSNVKNINPAPNVDDMITLQEPLVTYAENEVTTPVRDCPKHEEPVINSNGHSDDEVDSGVVNNNVVHMDEYEEGNRNSVVVDAMNKDQKWKTDSVYQKDLSSLKLLCDYGSDSDDDNNVEGKEKSKGKTEESVVEMSERTTEESMEEMTEGAMEESVVEKNEGTTEELVVEQSSDDVQIISSIASTQNYRKPESDTETDDSDDSSEEDESSTSSSSEEESSSSSEESDNSSSNECVVVEEKKRQPDVPKTKGELGLDDLPPIEELHISVPESLCVEIGKVMSIVDSLVVVQSIKGCPTLDLDSVLFMDHGQNALGQVFDVLGKVGEACYCIRFNSKDHALEKGVTIGMPVYFAPQTEHSKFVFLADLMKMKGSDASWEHNNEPPDKFLDYSDDEDERRAKKGDRPVCREVEADETQPQAKRAHRRGGRGRGRGGRGTSLSDPSQYPAAPGNSHSPHRPGSTPWGTPSNLRFERPLMTGEDPRRFMGPQPLLRPAAFSPQTPPPIRHYQYSCAASPSPWAVPPPVVSHNDPHASRGWTPTPPPPFPSPQPSPSPVPPAFQPPYGGQVNSNVSPGGFGPPSETFGGLPRGFRPPSRSFGSSGFGETSESFVNPGVFNRPPPLPGASHFGQSGAFGEGGYSPGTFSNVRPQQFDFGSTRPSVNSASPTWVMNGAPNNAGQFGRQPSFQNHNSSWPPQQGWMG